VQKDLTSRRIRAFIIPPDYYTRYSYYDPYVYSYYGPAYDTTVVRSGVRYNDAYSPRYYRARTVYGDWY
jgi:hypothetical protein